MATADLNFEEQRNRLVDNEIRRQGVWNQAVLSAMRTVPREEFVAPELKEFAYRNVALPIELSQTISQPQIVAIMAEALELSSGDRVLEIGTGSGYAAAVLGHIAAEVFSVERHEELAKGAEKRLAALGYDNIRVLHGDGTLGWPEHAPYDAIVVAAGGPDVPRSLLDQLKVGGRLVIPVGDSPGNQTLLRITRTGVETYRKEDLGGVRFVPLVGAEGWDETAPTLRHRHGRVTGLAGLIKECAEPIDRIENCHVDALLDRIGQSRLVLIGEATHGTSEFYRIRAEITKSLVRERGFNFVAIEADWPDASRINQFVQHEAPRTGRRWEAFSRFPTWMWRNQEVLQFVDWLHQFNRQQPARHPRVGFYGLDLYNLFGSIRAVLDYLDRVDPQTAHTTLSIWCEPAKSEACP